MHVYLIRHAQSENNVLTSDSLHRRKVDPDLTELGYRQRDALADFLANEAELGDQPFAIRQCLYTSAMYRSLLDYPAGSRGAEPATASMAGFA